MKNIFKLIILITIILNFTACDNNKPKIRFIEEKPYVNPHTSMEAPKQRDKEIQKMDLFVSRSKAVQLGDTQAGTQIGMAYYEQLEDYDKAIEWFIYSNSIKPTGKNSDSACTVYSAKGDFKEAIKWCKQAIDLDYQDSITGLGLVYARDNDFENALIWLKKGDELNQPKASTALGFVYNKLGDLKRAEEYYLKAIKNYPKDIRNVSNLIHFYHKDLKDNVRASAWAIAGVNNIFDALSVTDLLLGDWEISLEDLQKGYDLQLTSDEFPYNYEQKERKLGMLHKSGYDERLESYRKKKKEEQQKENER